MEYMRSRLLMFIFCLLSTSLFFTLFNIEVYAANQNPNEQKINVCLSDGVKYEVSWDTTINTEVSADKIDATAIENGHVAYPDNFSGDLTKYAISSAISSFTCYKDSNNEIKTCDDTLADYLASDLVTSVTQEFNITTGKYTIRIKDPYNGKVKIRVVGSGTPNDGTKKSNEYTTISPIWVENINGYKDGYYFVINNVSPSIMTVKDNKANLTESVLKLETYLSHSESDCNSYYIASATIIVNTPPDAIPNPAISNPATYGCNEAKKILNDLKKDGYNDEIVNAIRDGYVPICYKSTVTYDEYQDLSNEVKKQVDELKDFIKDFIESDEGGESSINTGSGFWCNKSRKTKSRLVYAKSGSYWNITCKEYYEITTDPAKLVRAGSGFNYESIFEVHRTCQLKQHTIVKKKPECLYSCSSSCSYDERSGRKEGQPNAGPSEDFDACVASCDNGAYTQECINSCYQQVYGNDRTLPQLTNSDSKKMSFLDKKYGVKKISSEVIDTVVGNDDENCSGTTCSHPSCPDGFSYTFSNYCNEHKGVCTVTLTKGPSDCVGDPEEIYRDELKKSNAELDEYLSHMNPDTINIGTYNIKVDDSYLIYKSGSGDKVYQYSVTDDYKKNNDATIVTSVRSGENDGCESTQDFTLGNDGGEYSSRSGVCTSNSHTKIITTNLVKSYLNKKDGNAAYLTGLNTYSAFDTSLKPTTNLLKKISFKKSVYYSVGRKYYTNLLSPNTNVSVLSRVPENFDKSTVRAIELDDGSLVMLDSYATYKSKTNKQAAIKVSVSGLGDGSYSDSINCFYGVYNDTFCKGRDECPSDDDGIQFIFRPIDLDDVFPNEDTSNRKPRWNWTNGASTLNDDKTAYTNDKLLNYKIKPESLTADIEKYGYNVYNDPNELDYEILLTPAHITKIRDYNKNIRKNKNDYNKDGSYNYLDYDMSCDKDGNREVCYSKFLNNNGDDGYLKFLNISTAERQDLAICNNVRGKKCVD